MKHSKRRQNVGMDKMNNRHQRRQLELFGQLVNSLQNIHSLETSGAHRSCAQSVPLCLRWRYHWSSTRVLPSLPSLSFPMSFSPLSLAHLDLCSVVEHVFLPPKLPQEAQCNDAESGTNVALCHILIDAAAAFRKYLSPSQEFVWDRMVKMIEYVLRAASSPLEEADLEGVLAGLAVDGELKLPLARRLALYIRFQMSL